MTKITHNFYQAKTKRTSGGLFGLFVLMLASTQASWGQQPIATGQFDGGFENAVLYTTGALSATTPDAAKWSYDSSNISTSNISTVDKRSGSKSFYLNNTGTSTGKYIMSPILSPALTGGDGTAVGSNYVVQYYVKSGTATATKGAISVDARASGVGTQATADANGWQKVTYRYVGNKNVALAKTWVGFGNNQAVALTGYVDDLVVYLGAADDNTLPDVATGPVVNGLNVSWTAPSTGVDGGGYMVVRYATNPNADNDPNLNGIYAVGNTITNGTGALVGTVVYLGTATLFTDGVAGSVSGSDYYKIYTVDKAFNYSTEITGTAPLVSSTTWTTAWSNGSPSSTVEGIIDGVYSGVGFDAKKLTINSGKSLTITSGTITVQNEVINNGSFALNNNANLIQVNSASINTGAITVNRNGSPLLRLDYSLWSSPVDSQNLAAFSPLTSQSPSRFYSYDSATDLYTAIASPTTTNFTLGGGSLIRMPNTADAVTPTAFAGVFTGVPNNGDIAFALSTSGNKFNLVGNPYPSPITMATFVSDNSSKITGTLYFWRKTNGAGTAYCTWAGGTFTTNSNAQTVDPLGIIQTGQGFFVQATTTGSVTFKNGQRAANTAGQFFKTKQVATSDKVWLNATNTAGDFSQTALNYTAGATQGVDAFDGKYINDSAFALTSNINNEEYTIQGRPAFDASDVVALNFKTAVAGDYTIAIDHTAGVFASGQNVILTDATTGTETDLTTGSYTFTAAAGTSNSRFSLKYQKTLGTNQSVLVDNAVTVYKNKGTLSVNAGDVVINNVKVYDVQGRLVAELKDVKATSATVANLKATNQVLVVKVTLEGNKVVTKKVVN